MEVRCGSICERNQVRFCSLSFHAQKVVRLIQRRRAYQIWIRCAHIVRRLSIELDLLQLFYLPAHLVIVSLHRHLHELSVVQEVVYDPLCVVFEDPVSFLVMRVIVLAWILIEYSLNHLIHILILLSNLVFALLMLDHHEFLVEHNPWHDQAYIQYICQNRSKAHDQANFSVNFHALIVISIDFNVTEDSKEF